MNILHFFPPGLGNINQDIKKQEFSLYGAHFNGMGESSVSFVAFYWP